MIMHDIEDELVHQKNHILSLVNEGKYEDAVTLLNFSEELWAKASYGYKTKEIRERIREEVRNLVLSSEHHKTRQMWSNLLTRIS